VVALGWVGVGWEVEVGGRGGGAVQEAATILAQDLGSMAGGLVPEKGGG